MTAIDPRHSLAALDLYDATFIRPSQHNRTVIFDGYTSCGWPLTGDLLAGAMQVLASAVKTIAVHMGESEEDVVTLLRVAYLAAEDSA